MAREFDFIETVLQELEADTQALRTSFHRVVGGRWQVLLLRVQRDSRDGS